MPFLTGSLLQQVIRKKILKNIEVSMPFLTGSLLQLQFGMQGKRRLHIVSMPFLTGSLLQQLSLLIKKKKLPRFYALSNGQSVATCSSPSGGV